MAATNFFGSKNSFRFARICVCGMSYRWDIAVGKRNDAMGIAAVPLSPTPLFFFDERSPLGTAMLYSRPNFAF